jgi:hypothetical protein
VGRSKLLLEETIHSLVPRKLATDSVHYARIVISVAVVAKENGPDYPMNRKGTSDFKLTIVEGFLVDKLRTFCGHTPTLLTVHAVTPIESQASSVANTTGFASGGFGNGSGMCSRKTASY